MKYRQIRILEDMSTNELVREIKKQIKTSNKYNKRWYKHFSKEMKIKWKYILNKLESIKK